MVTEKAKKGISEAGGEGGGGPPQGGNREMSTKRNECVVQIIGTLTGVKFLGPK